MLERRGLDVVQLARPLLRALETDEEERHTDGDTDDRGDEVDPLEVALLFTESAVQDGLKVVRRPFAHGLIVYQLAAFAVLAFVNGFRLKIRVVDCGILAKFFQNKVFESAVVCGDVLKRAVTVGIEVEREFFGGVSVLVHVRKVGDDDRAALAVHCELDLGNDALISVDVGLQDAGHTAGDLRHHDGDDARAGGAQQTRYGQQVAAAEGVVGHAGVQPPVRHVADGVHHAPDYVHDGHCRKSAGIGRIPRQEAQDGHHRNGDRHPFKIRTALAPRGARSVDDGTHDRVVQCVVNSRKQHE